MSFQSFKSQAELVGKIAKVATILNTLNNLINSEVGRVLNDLAKDNLKEAYKTLDRSKNSKDYVSWQLEITSARDFFIHAKILFSNAAKKNKLIAIVAKASEALCLLYTAQCNEMLGYQKDRKENLEAAKEIYLWLMKPPIQDQLVPTIKILLPMGTLLIFCGIFCGTVIAVNLAVFFSIPSVSVVVVGLLIGAATTIYFVLKFPSNFVSYEEYTQLGNLISKEDPEEEIITLINFQQTRIDKARKVTSLIHPEGWIDDPSILGLRHGRY